MVVMLYTVVFDLVITLILKILLVLISLFSFVFFLPSAFGKGGRRLALEYYLPCIGRCQRNDNTSKHLALCIILNIDVEFFFLGII